MQIRDRITELRRVPARELLPNPRNWRTHTRPQSDALKGLLSEVGYADALIARQLPDGKLMLIDGHLRAETTPDMRVPVLVLDVTEQEADKLMLSLDPLAAMAEADNARLKDLIAATAFESEAVGALLARLAKEHGLTERYITQNSVPDPTDELKKKWGTAPGQTWAAARHRVICARWENAALPPKEEVALLLADPPYGVEAVNMNRGSGHAGAWANHPVYRPIIGDDQPFDPRPLVQQFPRAVLWGGNYFADKLPATSSWLVWDKKGDLEPTNYADCELAWTSLGGPARIFDHMWRGVIRDSERAEKRQHPTQKPVALMAWIIEQWTKLGEIVVDPFLGSGTTLIACHQLDRTGIGCEVDPGYVAVALERLAALGLKPELIKEEG